MGAGRRKVTIGKRREAGGGELRGCLGGECLLAERDRGAWQGRRPQERQRPRSERSRVDCIGAPCRLLSEPNPWRVFGRVT